MPLSAAFLSTSELHVEVALRTFPAALHVEVWVVQYASLPQGGARLWEILGLARHQGTATLLLPGSAGPGTTVTRAGVAAQTQGFRKGRLDARVYWEDAVPEGRGGTGAPQPKITRSRKPSSRDPLDVAGLRCWVVVSTLPSGPGGELDGPDGVTKDIQA